MSCCGNTVLGEFRYGILPRKQVFHAAPFKGIYCIFRQNSMLQFLKKIIVIFIITNGHYWILWSEEGSSLGGLRISGDESTSVYDYRCVRNLGIDINNAEAPQHYARIENDSNYYTIDVSYINPAALRREADNGTNLPFGNEKSQSNRPFREFDVRHDNENGLIAWSDIEGYIENNQDYMLCPDGWRVPNQREFTIMMGLIDSFLSGNGNVLIATSFSFNGEKGDDSENGNKYNFTGRPGFYYTKDQASANLALISGDAYGYIRCVRDTPSAY